MSRGRRFVPAAVLWTLVSAWIFSEIYYPWNKVYVGALDAGAWAGLAIAPERDCFFAFRIRAGKEQTSADGKDFLFLVSEVGPHSPDGRFARVSFDLSLPFGIEADTPILKKPGPRSDVLTLEWSRQDEHTVIGRIICPRYLELNLIHYFPWNFKGQYQYRADGQVKGESLSLQKYHYLFWTDMGAEGRSDARGPVSDLSVIYNPGRKRRLYFVAGVGEDARILENHIYRYKNIKTIDSILIQEEARYQKNRVQVDGLYRGVEKAITQNIFWMSLYQPGSHRLYTPAGRGSIFPRNDGSLDFWTIFEWNSFFSALEAGIESTVHSIDILHSVLETQYPNGNIPNWRGGYGGTRDRSQPPVGSFVVLKLFQKFGDMDILRYAYPYLKKWHAFWKSESDRGRPRRDGNGDGLLEWGSDKELIANGPLPGEGEADGKVRAMWESGQQDLPNWDDAGFNSATGTLTMNCLDLNCLYTLDAFCLSQIAAVLKIRRESEAFLEEYERMKALINDRLWNEQEGFYFDRHWDGRFSERKAASNFYPLLARIPDRERALRMLKHLLNEEEFQGDYVIPTISKDDPAFNDQHAWRGSIWPPTNYLVYQGLKAYHFDPAASEFARKSAGLFLRSWENFQLCPESFDARTGEAGGRRYQSWGPLIALIALEEYIDFTPWEGFRFGMIDPERKGKLHRLFVQGRHYDITISRRSVRLLEEGREIIRTDGGAVFRHFLYSESEVAFEINSLEDRSIVVHFLTHGKYQLLIDGELQEIFKGRATKIRVPRGEHEVLILLLEKSK